jgi:hypothetical protein
MTQADFLLTPHSGVTIILVQKRKTILINYPVNQKQDRFLYRIKKGVLK